MCCFIAEEEWKRYYLSLKEGYQSVGFSYDQNGMPVNQDYAQQGIDSQVFQCFSLLSQHYINQSATQICCRII